jgi:hypothetical protein
MFPNTLGHGVQTLKSWAIKGDNAWNNHQLVEAVVELETSTAHKSIWKKNSSLLAVARLVIE